MSLDALILAAAAMAAVDGTAMDILETPSSVFSGAPSEDGEPLLKQMLHNARAMKAYSFESSLYVFVKNKRSTERGRFYIKSPNLIRFEAIQAGKKTGSVVVRGPDGKIRCKAGGALGGIQITLSPDSRLLKASNGISVIESDFASLLGWAIGRLQGGLACISGQLDGSPQIVEMIEQDGDVVERMSVDPAERLPLGWSVFADKKLSSVIRVENLVVSADLPDSLFTLAGWKGAKSPEEQVSELSSEIASLLASRGRQVPTVWVFKDIGRVLDLLRGKAIALKQASLVTRAEPGGAGQRASWAPGAQEHLVISATEMESLLSVVDCMTVSLEILERRSLTPGRLHSDWSGQASACRAAVGRLIDFALEENPNEGGMRKSLDDVLSFVGKLEETRKRGIDLL
ncbi:MAG TPA: hypothetical protein V6D08_09025 [Candidatus Obscuribacterales bacterium]